MLNPNPSGPLIDMLKVLLNMAFIFRRYSNLKFKLICLVPVKVCSPRTFLSAFVIDTAELDSAMSKRMQSLTPRCHDITEMYVHCTVHNFLLHLTITEKYLLSSTQKCPIILWSNRVMKKTVSKINFVKLSI